MTFRFGEGKGADPMPFKKFESSEAIEEKKRKRQEEWEKVRRPDQPLTAPEEVYDPRSLYEQLQANKQKAQDALDEKHRLSNMVRGLEDEEAAFLDFVSNRQVELDNQRKRQEEDALKEYRNAVVSGTAQTSQATPKIVNPQPSAAAASSTKKSQQALLKGAVKRKHSEQSGEDGIKQAKLTAESSPAKGKNAAANGSITTDSASNHGSTDKCSGDQSNNGFVALGTDSKTTTTPTIRVGGVLPGLCQYVDSETSDSDSSSSDSDDLGEVPVFQNHRKAVMSPGCVFTVNILNFNSVLK